MTNRSLHLLFALLLTFHISLASLTEHNVNSHASSVIKSSGAVDYIPSLLRRRTAHTEMLSETDMGSSTSTHQSTIETVHTYNSPSKHRRTKDAEEILSGMAHKDPSQWEPTEWFVFLLFISLFGWIACCLCTMCCCGRGGPSNILGWLCFWEICCRDGRDLDVCCDTYVCG